jgi:hypothetical protein
MKKIEERPSICWAFLGLFFVIFEVWLLVENSNKGGI